MRAPFPLSCFWRPLLKTADIYHLVFNPPPSDIASQLVKLPGDEEPRMQSALAQYRYNHSGILSCYGKIARRINVDQPLVRNTCLSSLCPPRPPLASFRVPDLVCCHAPGC